MENQTARNLIFSVVLAVTLLHVPFANADTIVLNDGSALKGRIVDENKTQLTIILGTNMTLHVERENIREIHRTKKKNDQDPKKLLLAEHVAVASVTIPTHDLTTSIGKVTLQQRWELSSESRNDTVWTGVIQNKDNGVSWKSVVIVSTSYVRADYWLPISSATIKLEPLRKEEAGHQKVHTRFLHDFAEGISELTSNSEAQLRTESKQVYDVMAARAKKRLKGFDRYWGSSQRAKKNNP